jgi:hypothetical protein
MVARRLQRKIDSKKKIKKRRERCGNEEGNKEMKLFLYFTRTYTSFYLPRFTLGAELERILSTTSTSSRNSLSGKKLTPAGNSDELYHSTSITSEDCRQHDVVKKKPKLLMFASGGLRKRKIT